MTFMRSVCALLLCFGVVAADAAAAQEGGRGDAPRNLNAGFVLGADEVPSLRAKAAKGDAEASHRLSDHYGLGLGDSEQSMFWLRLSAEQGGCPALEQMLTMYRMANLSKSSENQRYFQTRYDRHCVAWQGKAGYIRFAREFRQSVIAGDQARIVRIVGNPSLTTAPNLSYLLGRPGNDLNDSFKSFFTEHPVVTFVEISDTDERQTAIVYFVRADVVEQEKIVDISQLKGKNFLTDFVACEVRRDGERIFMPNHLCFYETDVFGPDDY